MCSLLKLRQEQPGLPELLKTAEPSTEDRSIAGGRL